MTMLSAPTTTETTETPTTRVPWRGGWAAMPHTATRSDLPNNAYRVLGLLIGHMDFTTCEVHGQSAQRLAKEVGWSTRTVERGLATLRATGWVSAYPDPAPYRLGWLVYVVRREATVGEGETVGDRETGRQGDQERGASYAGSCDDVPPTVVSDPHRQNCRRSTDTNDGGVPTVLSVHDQESGSDSSQKESPTPAVGDSALSKVTLTQKNTPSGRFERHRQERRNPTDRTDGGPPTALSVQSRKSVSESSLQAPSPPVAVIAPMPSKLTETERLLLTTGFHPSTACAFRDFDLRAVREELHQNDLLGWLPREDRDRRIGMLVIRWRRLAPEVLREREVGGSVQEPAATYAATREVLQEREVGSSTQEAAVSHAATRDEALELAAQSAISDTTQEASSEDEMQFDPWIERARQLRPAWTATEQDALARALRHAPNDGAAVVMAQVMLGVARRC